MYVSLNGYINYRIELINLWLYSVDISERWIDNTFHTRTIANGWSKICYNFTFYYVY